MSEAPYILYLDTRALAGERIAEIAAGHALGFKVLVATPTPEVFKSMGCAGLIVTRLGDYDAAQEAILGYLDEQRITLSGIVAWKDLEVELASRLSQRLGLVGSSAEAAANVRDKARTRRCLDAVANANPRYAVVSDEQAFLDGLQSVGLPALLKPAGNSGSRGIFVLDQGCDALQVYRAFRAYNTADKGEMYALYGEHALLEEQLVGSEHSVSGLVADGRVVINAIIDKTFDRSIPIQYENTTPSQLDGALQDRICAMVRAAVTATGIDWCGFHVDLMVTAQGPKILEIGGRLGGEFINSHLLPNSLLGYSPYQAVLQLACGVIPDGCVDRIASAATRAGQRVIMPPRTGQVTRVEGYERLWKRSEMRFLQVVAGEGAQMALPSERFKAYEIAYLIAQCALEDDIHAVLGQLASEVKVDIAQQREASHV
ncbi:acetyl-CoA carboxylase biotin carboxylase subunit family protein [Pseudomonas vranovensis]|uniref:Phosphoribosylglycinamide synthetase n=1 Tax=Pseudomonas vranovensis TaxID=321661 RepID=A0A423DGS9_9PSED|nr:ATP-grasp domain-containing protein [Pseudomonas vranovensis]ROL70760.1 phosphoribosylglycinamide synthetase [Pseudomonas vranovensis]